MSNLIISGKRKLFGCVNIEGSKNAILPIIAASVLASSSVELKNVPDFSDIKHMLEILKQMGATVEWQQDRVVIDPTSICTTILPEVLTNKIRASIFLLGPLLAKFGSSTSAMPGGCQIGQRPIDIHLAGFKDLGISVTEGSQVVCDASGFVGGTTVLRFASVGATENIIMCAVLAHLKTTIIKNCAKEPEIVDLCNFINQMGGKIYGAGTDTIVIVGVKKLYGISYVAIPDRIVAGTYMIAAAMCGGKIKVKNVVSGHNKSLIDKLVNLGCQIEQESDNIYLTSSGVLAGSQNIKTDVYPNFATDLQAPYMSMLCMAKGQHEITETLFEDRFKHVSELVKMGADIKICGNRAIIIGKHNCLSGALVESKDLRGGAALVLAGIAANGITKIIKADYIYRGYEKIDEKLSLLGANIYKED